MCVSVSLSLSLSVSVSLSVCLSACQYLSLSVWVSVSLSCSSGTLKQNPITNKLTVFDSSPPPFISVIHSSVVSRLFPDLLNWNKLIDDFPLLVCLLLVALLVACFQSNAVFTVTFYNVHAIGERETLSAQHGWCVLAECAKLGCSDRCEKDYEGHLYCACQDGFKLDTDNLTCVEQGIADA